MDSKADTRRRWWGGIFLVIALTMLLAGQTVLRGRLGAVPFVVFWLFCMLFTCLALVVAVMDAAAIRRRTMEERRALLRTTIDAIARERQLHSKGQDGQSGSHS